MTNGDDGGNQPFSGHGTALLVLVAAASLLVAFVLLVRRSESIDRTTVGSDSYSRSALGHRVLVDTLRDLGVPVLVNRNERAEFGIDALVVCAEPLASEAERVTALADGEHATLFVPRKRSGRADPDRPHWLGGSALLELPDTIEALRETAPGLYVVRAEEPDRWTRRAETERFPSPRIADLQLVAGADLRPLLHCGTGVLLGELRARPRCYVLSDPDPFANHGIDDGDNAAFAVALLDLLRPKDGRIVFDETCHGFALEPSVWTQLGKFPLVLLLVHALLLLGAVAWAASSRFGKAGEPEAAIAAGKTALIENVTALQSASGHEGPALRRYLRDRVRAAAARLHGRAGDDAAARGIVTARARSLGRADRWEAAANAVESFARHGGRAADAARIARTVHRELEEIVHGHR